MSVLGIIPARLESSRLHRKLLLSETGKPLIQYAWEAAQATESIDEVIVATDSPEIAAVVQSFGGRAEMTGDHPSGTDRIAEVARRCSPEAEIVVNIQGDEPEISPHDLNLLVGAAAKARWAEMATLATPITDAAILRDPACVKVVCNADSEALYFSRAAIPHVRDKTPEDVLRGDAAYPLETPWLLHLGVYAFQRVFLLAFTELPPGRLEQLEKLEQLRALEAGATIQVALVRTASVGIDTRDDYARFVTRQQERQV